MTERRPGCLWLRSGRVRSHVVHLNSSFGGGADRTAQQPSVLRAPSAPSGARLASHNSPPRCLKVQRTFACTVFTIHQACGKAARDSVYLSEARGPWASVSSVCSVSSGREETNASVKNEI
ncbi:hypothetical protein EYF80_056132 [Liparis tanakae]|uniref:Uncharacterized protein n=1 Tax=Liparis tanakae TaxID=230148 RepID=A0A4Z2EY79_9TELE|nr:hypothetical protein EYF80_056132 [Liparis tanakae]